MSGHSDLVVVANRLPVDADRTPSPGGLVSALQPALQEQRGCWVGWLGAPDVHEEPFHTHGIDLVPVALTSEDFQQYYEGFCNATLWPLYHDLIVTPEYHRSWWAAYQRVNRKFAGVVDKVAAPGATVWIQDYQLQLLPGLLRALRPDLKIGFFLHIPFPSVDLFRQLPWRAEIVEGLRGADLIGCHIESYAAHLRKMGLTQAQAFPISIDTSSLGPRDRQAEEHQRSRLPGTVLLGVDRLDYTKGILQRLHAFEELLEEGLQDTALVQIATPSRERIAGYQRERSLVEEAAGRVNGRFGQVGAPVVHYVHRSLPKSELRVFYDIADVMLVTPFKDGMNLVSKEYVSCHEDGSGALVLSEFAGAAEELTQAHLCNPYDVESIKVAIRQAIASRGTPQARERMQSMYQYVHTHDVHLWATTFLNALESA